MKRISAFVFAFIVMLSFTGCELLDGMSYLYTDKVSVDNLCICINDTADCCFAGAYSCEEYTDGMEITIPDEHDGKPIKRIGGYYARGVPVAFCLDISDLYMNAPEGSIYSALHSTVDEAQYQVVDLPYELNIGENIDAVVNVNNSYYPHIEEDGSVVYYHPVVSINCSEDNKTFYSENGRLYSKTDNTLVSDFDYANQ